MRTISDCEDAPTDAGVLPDSPDAESTVEAACGCEDANDEYFRECRRDFELPEWRCRARRDALRFRVAAGARSVFMKTPSRQLSRKVRFGRRAAPDRIE